MGSKTCCAEKSKMEVESNHKKASLVEKDGIFEAPELVNFNSVSLLPPCAPTPEKNNDEAVLNSDSPLTWVEDDDDLSPRTPKGDVFDPFAPGPDDLMLAPLAKKHANESKISVARRLIFDSGKENDNAEEAVLLDKIYNSILDAIVSEQTEEVVAENIIQEKDEETDFKTPTKIPLLSGIADTCPAAPRKSRSNLIKIDLGLCRKLDF